MTVPDGPDRAPSAQATSQAVCGRSFSGDTRYFPRSEYAGRTLLFCSEFCQRAFLADPPRFLQTHGPKAGNQQDCEFLREENS